MIPREQNCDVPNVNIEYDFKKKVYLAEFVGGPHQGRQVYLDKNNNVLEHNWEKLQDANIAPRYDSKGDEIFSYRAMPLVFFTISFFKGPLSSQKF